MAFFNFLNSSQTPAAQPAQEPPTNDSTNPPPSGDTGSTAPASVDPFNTLWEGDLSQAALGEGLNLSLTTEQLLPIAQKLDYTQQVPEELKQKVMSGGADAVSAIMEISNIVGRANYIHSTMSNAKVLEAAIEKANQNLEIKMNEKLRAYGLNETITSSNPAVNNPAIKPIVDQVQSRILQKFPNATKQELAAMTKDYFTTQLAPAFGLSAVASANSAGTKSGTSVQSDIDWATFFTT